MKLDMKSWELTPQEATVIRGKAMERLPHLEAGSAAFEGECAADMNAAQNAKSIRETLKWLRDIVGPYSGGTRTVLEGVVDELEQAAIAAGYKVEEPS